MNLTLSAMLIPLYAAASIAAAAPVPNPEVLSTSSHRPGLALRVLHQPPAQASTHPPVLFIHGSSFPSELAFAFPMDGESWTTVMARAGYDTWALDFLGYGHSDRYPEMQSTAPADPPGRARNVQADIDHAVDLIRARTGQPKVTLIAHSWGGSVAALYTQNHVEKVAALVLFAAVTPRFPAQAAQSNAAVSTPAAEPERITHAANDMTPAERIRLMDSLRPAGQPHALAPDVFTTWGPRWLASDPLATASHAPTVRFPAGPDQDIADLQSGRSYYDPARITVPTLLVRGAWDSWPSAADYTWLQDHLTSAPSRKMVVIPQGTHVLHLERNRHQLYEAVLDFLSSLPR